MQSSNLTAPVRRCQTYLTPHQYHVSCHVPRQKWLLCCAALSALGAMWWMGCSDAGRPSSLATHGRACECQPSEAACV